MEQTSLGPAEMSGSFFQACMKNGDRGKRELAHIAFLVFALAVMVVVLIVSLHRA
jgi:hypothetical protein